MAKSKDPAFLFYTADFLVETFGLTMSERGQYITLLCLQHKNGHLSKSDIKTALGKVSAKVMAKFVQDADGNYYNEPVESEIQRRIEYSKSRSENGQKGGRPKNHMQNHMESICKPYEKAYENHTETETVTTTKDISITNNNNTVSVSNNTTTTTNIFSQNAHAQDESDEYAIFTLKVMEYFIKNDFTSSSQDFIAYNESRAWRGIGGEDVKADFTRYADQWEEIQKMKNERFTR